METVKAVSQKLRGQVEPRRYQTLREKRATYKLHPNLAKNISSNLLSHYKDTCAYRNMKIENLGEVASLLGRVADWICNGNRKHSLAILGNIGTGKTTLLHALQHTMWDFKIYPYYVKAGQIMERSINEPDFIQRISREHILLLDDVGTEPQSIKSYGNEIFAFQNIIDYRYENSLQTIITSNLSMASSGDGTFLSTYGNRVYDRMIEMFDKLYITGDSYRK